MITQPHRLGRNTHSVAFRLVEKYVEHTDLETLKHINQLNNYVYIFSIQTYIA